MANILLIDDDEALRNAMRRMLERGGHTVTEAEDGKKAFKAAAEQRFDLIITDIIMPEMDGIEVIIALRERQADIPVIAISGGSWVIPKDLLLTNADVLGAVITLAKPFESRQLLEAVERALGRA